MKSLDRLFHLIKCRNIILNVMINIDEMKAASYCEQNISILIVDAFRQDVARLMPIDLAGIKALAIAFEISLDAILINGVENLFNTPVPSFFQIAGRCDDILTHLTLDRLLVAADVTDKWRFTVQLLDVAVISYISAHVGKIGPHNTLQYTVTNNCSDIQDFIFHERSFKCLGRFLNDQKAWVLERSERGSRQIKDVPELYLSTEAGVLADIWGPMWGQCRKDSPDRILQYNVENGTIYPYQHWMLEEESVPALEVGEMLCHWRPDNTATVEEIEQLSSLALSPTTVMLIGAGTRLVLKPCRYPVNAAKRKLRDSGLLYHRGIIKKSRYKDSETVQFQVGWKRRYCWSSA